MSWADVLSTAETAAIWWVVPGVAAWLVTKRTLLPWFRGHKARQEQILAQQATILQGMKGPSDEHRPTA